MSIQPPPARADQRHSSDQRAQQGRKPRGESLLSRLGFTGRFSPAPAQRRMAVVIGIVLALFSIYALRLGYLQTVKAEAIAKKAQAGRTMELVLPADRGTIYDSRGVPLAQTTPARNVTVDQTLVTGREAEIASQLAPILRMDSTTIQERLTGNKRFAYIAKRVSLEQWKAISALDLPGVLSERTAKREYPGGDVVANVVGFVGDDSHGLAGLEYGLDSELAGKDGSRSAEVDAAGRLIPTGSETRVEPVPGTSVRLNIDRDLQWVAQRAIATKVAETGAESGTVIAMDPKTGKIIAMATAPQADPNKPESGKKDDQGNRPVEESFEPGSTSKVVTLAAAIEEGLVNPMSEFVVPFSIERSGFTFKDAHAHGTERMTVAGILAKSSNVGTIKVGEKLGREKLYQYLTDFGFGQPSGLQFPGETSGVLPTLDQWSDTSLQTIVYGQGVSVNAIQAASVFATVANGGVRVQPSLIDSYIGADGSVQTPAAPPERRVISADTAAKMREMMEEVVTKDGTAPQAAIPGYRIAGKTGTAQRVNKGCKTYCGYTASFIGMAPAQDPQLVVAVFLQDPQTAYYGGSSAAPVFRDVMTAALQSRGIAPSDSPPRQMPLAASEKPGYAEKQAARAAAKAARRAREAQGSATAAERRAASSSAASSSAAGDGSPSAAER